jgi:hypothetical protein
LGIASWGAANDIVDFDIVIFTAHATSVHRIRELDENGVLLHDSLDMLTTDSNDALVVLVGDMERDGSGHFLLDKGQALLHGIVTATHDVDVEVVLIEAVKNDLHIACWGLEG